MKVNQKVTLFFLLVFIVFFCWNTVITAQSAITVTSPNGGEEWELESTQLITWETTNVSGNVQIQYSTDNGYSWLTLIESTENDGSYSWTLPDTVSSQCLVKVTNSESGQCETRGTWVLASSIITESGQDNVLQKIEAAKLNTVLVSTPPINGNWGYGSPSTFLSFIEKAKSKGISVHAWICSGRRLWGIGETYIEYRDNDEQDTHTQWVMDIMDAYGAYLDGVHLDYIRYQEFDDVNNQGKMDGVRATVRKINAALDTNYPNTLLTAAVFTLDPNRFDDLGGDLWTDQVPQWYREWWEDNPNTLYSSSSFYYLGPHHMQVQQDPVGWLQEGIVDALMPMQYTHDDEIWERETNYWKSFNQHAGNDFTRVYSAVAWKKGFYDAPQSIRMIKHDRSRGLKGNFIFVLCNHDTDDTQLIETLTIDSADNDFNAPYKTAVPSCLTCPDCTDTYDTSDTAFSIVQPGVETNSYEISEFSVFATNSILMRTGTNVYSGNIGVIGRTSGATLESGSEILLSENVRCSDNVSIYGDDIKLKPRTSVDDVYCNNIKNYGTIRGYTNSPLDVPLDIDLPGMPNPSPGTLNITVSANSTYTLSPGSYGEIKLNKLAELIITGGTYHVKNLNLGDYAKVYFKAPTQLFIKNRLESALKPVIGPKPGSGINAGHIAIYVKGKNGSSGNLNATPKAVTIGIRHTLDANIYAPNGTIWLKARGSSTGAFIAKDVLVEFYVNIRLKSAF